MLHRFSAFVGGITECYKYIQRIKAAEMTEFGLKGTHVMCLFYLAQNPEGLTAAQLCALCQEDKAAISRTLSELAEKGFLLPQSKKYRALLQLSPAGVQMAGQLDTLIAQWVGIGGDGLTDSQREAFYTALELISSNLQGKSQEKN